MKKVAVLQSNYIPWKGYFDIIHDVDEFIFYDEVQFTKNDWRNRNRISTPSGIQGLTIPTTGSITQSIDEVTTAGSQWQRKHFNSLVTYYSKAPYFSKYRAFLEDFYLGHEWKNLSRLNRYLITYIAHDFLGIQTKFTDSRDYGSSGSGHEKLLSLLQSAALMRDAVMNSTNDSAPLHLAVAVGAKVTALFCSTVPSFGFAPKGENIHIIETEEPLPCRPCGIHGHQQCPEGHFRCGYSIETAKLLEFLPEESEPLSKEPTGTTSINDHTNPTND